VSVPREEALRELLEEARRAGVAIHSDEEAQEYLDWTAHRRNVPPESIQAVTLGDVIYIRPELADNVRVLREELIHAAQQRAGITSDKILEAEVEARRAMIQNRDRWGITDAEVAEIEAEIRRIEESGRY
jgi:hypothetical protein